MSTNGKWEAKVTIPTGNWTATLREYVPEDVVWTAEYGVAITGNTITKNIATTDWDAGAISVATIAADGYVEFGKSVSANLICGLSNGDTDQGYADVDFALGFGGAAIAVHEAGSWVVDVGASAVGDSYRVQVVAGVVTYWRKPAAGAWTFLYESLGTPTFPLLVDSSIYSEGSAITDAVIASTGAGATITLTAAKTYYHSSAGNDTVDLGSRLAALCTAAGAGYTYVFACDNAEGGTGRYSITGSGVVGGLTINSFSLTWVSTALRDLLGFTASPGADGVLAATYTSQGAAQGLWLPDGPPLNLVTFGDEIDQSDQTVSRSPDATANYRLAYNRVRTLTDLKYQAISRARARIAGETYANESFAQFWRDVIDMDLAAYLARGRVLIYPDASTDTTFYDYWIGAMRDNRPASIVEGWQGLWTIVIPLLTRVET